MRDGLDVGVFYPLRFRQALSNSSRTRRRRAAWTSVTPTAVEVLVDEGRATGVRTASGDTIDADAVVVNADLAVRGLVIGDAARSDASSRYSTSSITFLWALVKRFEQLQGATYFCQRTMTPMTHSFLKAWDDHCRVGRGDGVPGQRVPFLFVL